MYVIVYCYYYTYGVSWIRIPPKAALFSLKNCLPGCVVLLCFCDVCMTLLAYFFLLSASLNNMYMLCIYIHYVHMYHVSYTPTHPHTDTHTHTHTHPLCTCEFQWLATCIYMYVYRWKRPGNYIHVHVQVYIMYWEIVPMYMYIHVYICMYVCMYMYMYVCIDVHIHIIVLVAGSQGSSIQVVGGWQSHLTQQCWWSPLIWALFPSTLCIMYHIHCTNPNVCKLTT